MTNDEMMAAYEVVKRAEVRGGAVTIFCHIYTRGRGAPLTLALDPEDARDLGEHLLDCVQMVVER